MYEKLAAANPTTEVLNTLADAYMKEKQYDKAIRIYKKLIESEPEEGRRLCEHRLRIRTQG